MITESPNPFVDRFDWITDLEDLDPAALLGIEGSLGEERKNRLSKDVNADYRLYIKLQKTYTYQLSSIVPEIFYNSLAEITTLYPHLPGVGEFQIFGLSVFEGKGGSSKWRDLLVYLSYKPDDFFFVSEILINKIVSRLTAKKELEGSWLELQKLLLVFGSRRFRLEYLELEYNKRALGNMKKRGKAVADHLRISLVRNILVKPIQRKLGYNDHGSTAEQHENHGDKDGYDYVYVTDEEFTQGGESFRRIYSYNPAKVIYKSLRTTMKITNFKHPERPPVFKKVPFGQKVVKSYIPSEFDIDNFEVIKEVNLMNKDGRDLNQILVDIFKSATQNYYAWLEKETKPSLEVAVTQDEQSSPK